MRYLLSKISSLVSRLVLIYLEKDLILHRLFSVAPMVDVTNSTFRRMARILSKKALLYTEMIAADALCHEKYHLIDFKDEELPLVLQLGGNDEAKLAKASQIGEKRGYSAINLNAGCPSDKVQSGAFGAVLMHEPKKLQSLVKAMIESVSIPVSVKTRIGVDEKDSFDFTVELVSSIYEAGCREITLHARKAWLNGLSPKENRTIPPLDYERVYAIKSMFPDLHVTINGGITTIDECKAQLQKVDGVMLGRAIIDNPYLLALVDREIYGEEVDVKTRDVLLSEFVELAKVMQSEGTALHHLFRHLLGFYQGMRGAKRFRRHLSDYMTSPTVQPSLLLEAREAMERV